MTPLLCCPRCSSTRVTARNYGRKTGGAIGTIAGATSKTVAVLGGAEIGASVGAFAGPPGMVVGSLAGAVLGALVGGAAGCATGVSIGSVIDDNVLDNFACGSCGHTFSRHHAVNDSAANDPFDREA